MLIHGGQIVSQIQSDQGFEYIFTGDLKAATTTAVGGVLKLQNTTGRDLIITNLLLDITTKSTGAATVDGGVDDGGDVSSDILIDGLDVNAAAGLFNSTKHAGTNGTHAALWKKEEYVVISASATVAGLVGTYKIRAIAR